MISEQAKGIISRYDYEPREEIAPFVEIPSPDTWNICCLLGQSGTGKTTSLKRFGNPADIYISDDKPVIDYLDDVDATARMFRRCGFSSIPSWCLPYSKLSNGEKYRVQIAFKILRGDNPIILDEFGSYLDETSSVFLAKVVKKLSAERKFLVATLNPVIAEELQADVLLELGTPQIRRLVQRNGILQLQRCSYSAWEIFKKHHYMNHTVMKNTKCFLLTYNNEIVGFSSAIPLPSRNWKNAYREHRTVILPNYQGTGLGITLSDLIASIAVANDKIYFSKTVHQSFGEYRESSNKWKPTRENRRGRPKINRQENFYGAVERVSYSHQYIGKLNTELMELWDDNPIRPDSVLPKGVDV